jgi:hypothetical protein
MSSYGNTGTCALSLSHVVWQLEDPPATAHLLYEAMNRLDGVKMFAIAAVALAAGTATVLPRWLRWLGVALGISITASEVAYLFLFDSLAWLAHVAGVLLLLAFIPSGRNRRGADMPRAGLSRERVIEQAAAVADEAGPEHLTLAVVAPLRCLAAGAVQARRRARGRQARHRPARRP